MIISLGSWVPLEAQRDILLYTQTAKLKQKTGQWQDDFALIYADSGFVIMLCEAFTAFIISRGKAVRCKKWL